MEEQRVRKAIECFMTVRRDAAFKYSISQNETLRETIEVMDAAIEALEKQLHDSRTKEEEAIMNIYKKLNVDGTLKEPITMEEQVLLFGIAKKMEEKRNGKI